MIEKFLHYIVQEKRYSKHTFEAYRIDLDQFQYFLETTFQVSDSSIASFQMIRSWVVSLMESEITSRSVNRKIASLRSYYKFLLKSKHIAIDPTLKLKAPKVKKALPVFVEEANMHALLDGFHFEEDFSGTRDKLLFELIYGTGIRLSELIHLEESMVSLFDKSIKVRGKGNKERIIPINSSLCNLIERYSVLKKDTFNNNNIKNLIVTDKGSKCYPVFVYRIVKKHLSSVTTLEKKSPHVLRHTFATHLLNKGADLNAIKELLGHSSLAATQVYTHNSLEKLKTVFKQAHPKS